MKKNITDLQLNQIKGELKKRPLLAIKLNLTLEQLEKFLNGEKVSRIDIGSLHNILLNDRREKCERLRSELSKVVGYRESKVFSEKMEISDTILRNIIENKGPLPSNDTIVKLECFLHYLNGYKVSFDNWQIAEKFVAEHIDDLATQVYEIGRDIQIHSHEIKNLQEFIKTGDKKKLSSFERSNLSYRKNCLTNPIEKLNKISKQINTLTEIYLKME